MPTDYIAKFTVQVSFTARNEQQAAERCNQIEEWLLTEIAPPDKRKRPWLGDIGTAHEGFEEA